LEIVAVHAALMRGPNGPEVVMYSPPRERDEHGNFIPNPEPKGDCWFWDPEKMVNPESRTLDLTTWTTRDVNPWNDDVHLHDNIFCSGASHLPDGRLLVAGGHVHANCATQCGEEAQEGNDDNGGSLHCYDPAKPQHPWAKLDARMAEPRWYPTVTPLPDGRMLIASGSGEGLWYSDDEYFKSIQNSYVVYDGNELTAAECLIDVEGELQPPLATYPGVFVLPDADDGAVVVLVETHRAWLYRYHTTGKALRQYGGPRVMTTQGSRSYPWYGSMVLLPLHPGQTSRNILAVGGTHEHNTHYTRLVGNLCELVNQDEVGAEDTTSTAQLLTVNVSGELADTDAAKWECLRAEQSRFLCDATLLADGTVLVSGGARRGWANNNSGPVNEAELFDPEKKEFRLAATATTERRYHAVALLLPDGTVLKAGSNGGFGGPPGTEGRTQEWFDSRTSGERYLPPYLWRGPRPVITDILATSRGDITTLHHGRPVLITVTGPSLDAHSKAALIRLGATTHGNDMEQRYVWLDVSDRHRVGDEWTLHTTAPANGATAPPGDYMLVVVDSNAVPSEASLVRISNHMS
jgi:hypothetical protein